VLEVSSLSCARGDRTLFRDLSFSVNPGEILHLKGPNGVGKTTLLRCLAGLGLAQSGEIRWQGDILAQAGDRYGASLGFVGHKDGIHGELTPAENLAYAASLHGDADTANIDDTLGTLGLSHCRHLPTKLLSQGQKRRLALARLLVCRYRLWLLDEPFTALDVESRAQLESFFKDHLARGGMIMMTSHHALENTTAKELVLHGA
jgi:heme exporter protein A